MNSTERRRKMNPEPRRRRSRRRRSRILAICTVIEILVVITLVAAVGWKAGLGNWVANLRNPAVQELDLSGINSPYAVLMQARSGKVIGEIQGTERMYPASLTKIMTAIVAIEELGNLDQEITLTNEMVAGLYAQDASQAGFQPGENVRAIDLLYGVMLPSGAECCIALADTIAGSEAGFVELMNAKAEKLKMMGTHFMDSTGLHDPEHYSTAEDMAVLLRYALKNDTFREIIESPWHSTPGTNIHPDGITYYSTMFKNLSSTAVTDGEIKGGKTGFTSAAGCCLASFAQIGGTEYILVTAGAMQGGTPHINDAVTVYNRLGEAALALGSK